MPCRSETLSQTAFTPAVIGMANTSPIAPHNVPQNISATVTGPFVSPERFAVLYAFDRTNKASGERGQLSEVAVYTVVDGKIAHEEFLYAAKS